MGEPGRIRDLSVSMLEIGARFAGSWVAGWNSMGRATRISGPSPYIGGYLVHGRLGKKR
jgi:hypothetical protein